MKKFFMITMMLVAMITTAHAQGKAEIKFDKTLINIGTFPESASEQTRNTTRSLSHLVRQDKSR